MTVPTGSPDWQHIDVKTGLPLFYNPTLSASGITFTPVLAVGNYSQLWLDFDPSGTSSYKVQLIWLDAFTGGHVIYTQSFLILAPSGKLSITVPTLQPWVQVEIIPITFVAGDTIRAVIAPVGDNSTLGVLNGPMIAELIRSNIAAGNTIDTVGGAVAPGRARWFFGLDGAMGVFTILTMQSDGSFAREYTIGPVTGPSFQVLSIVLPGAPVKVETQNTGAGAANFWNVLGTEA